jgi:hypothetical protein
MPVRRKRERCFKFMINQKECITSMMNFGSSLASE